MYEPCALLYVYTYNSAIITNVTLGNTREAEELGFEVRNGRLERRSVTL